MPKKDFRKPVAELGIKNLLNKASLDELEKIQAERIQAVPISQIDDFKNHPFKVLDNEDMEQLTASIKENGVLTPVIVRKKDDGRYELISGHRRRHAAIKAGLSELPAIIKSVSEDEATIAMVDANLQREKILPSEKAFAYKMKLEAMKRQGKRTDLTSSPVGTKFNRSSDEITAATGDSRNQIHRYIRLTELIPSVLQMVDDGKIAFRPAVELSYLPPKEQQELLNVMDRLCLTPSLIQAQELKSQSKTKKLTEAEIKTILSAGDFTGEKAAEMLTEQEKEFTSELDRFRNNLDKLSPEEEDDGEIIISEEKPNGADELVDESGNAVSPEEYTYDRETGEIKNTKTGNVAAQVSGGKVSYTESGKTEKAPAVNSPVPVSSAPAASPASGRTESAASAAPAPKPSPSSAAPAPAPSPKPSPSPAPSSTPEPPASSVVSYQYGYRNAWAPLEQMEAELNAYAESIGLVYDETLTLDNSSWESPDYSFQFESTKKMTDYLKDAICTYKKEADFSGGGKHFRLLLITSDTLSRLSSGKYIKSAKEDAEVLELSEPKGVDFIIYYLH